MAISDLSPAQLYRRLRLGANKRVLVDAGIIDETGKHTEAGRNLMWAILFDNFEDELVAAVKDTQEAEPKSKTK